MSYQSEAWYRELYLDKVTFAYKNAGFMLKPMVMPPSRMDGKKLYFPVAKPGTATETRRGVKVGRMNAGREMKEVTAKYYEAADVAYDLDQDKFSMNELQIIAKTAADALGQKHDGVIMGGVHAGSGGYGTVVGDFGSGWDLQRALEAETLLFEKTENPRETAFCILPVRAFNQMKTYEAFSSSLYNGDYPLAKGVQARTWSRTHWVQGYDAMFPTANTTEVTFYMWFQNAVGSGDGGGESGSPIKTSISRLAEERAWLHDNMIEIGATVLIPDAIQECRMKKGSAISFS